MKLLAYIIIASALNGALHAQQNYDMAAVNQLIQDLKDEKLDVVETALDVSARQDSAKFQQLENTCKNDWSIIIDNFEAIEGGDASKKLVVSAFQALDAGDYMSAIEKLVTRYEAGTTSKQVILEALSPSGRMRAFLADNYTHTRVAAALNKIKVKAGEDPEIKPLVDDLLSGNIKTGFDEIREDFAGTGYGNIPQILLP